MTTPGERGDSTWDQPRGLLPWYEVWVVYWGEKFVCKDGRGERGCWKELKPWIETGRCCCCGGDGLFAVWAILGIEGSLGGADGAVE